MSWRRYTERSPSGPVMSEMVEWSECSFHTANLFAHGKGLRFAGFVEVRYYWPVLFIITNILNQLQTMFSNDAITYSAKLRRHATMLLIIIKMYYYLQWWKKDLQTAPCGLLALWENRGKMDQSQMASFFCVVVKARLSSLYLIVVKKIDTMHSLTRIALIAHPFLMLLPVCDALMWACENNSFCETL